VPYLPVGRYEIGVAEGAYEAVRREIDITADAAFDINLADRVITPYNITATRGDDGSVTVNWNQELLFSDSFEEYDDFATGSFGEWLTVDVDKQPVYPISLGSLTNIVTFPGSGNATNPAALAPMVFNPYKTVPAMMPTDPAIAAVTGDKSVIFFSSQMAKSDKWLITPPISIRDQFRISFKAKGYTSMYTESLELCISTEASTNPADFTTISVVDQLTSEAWSLYYTDLDEYAGQTARLAIRYTSYDAFLAQVDDVTVGPQSGQGEYIDYGNVVRYEIYLDGVKAGESETPEFVFDDLGEGDHTVGIKAIYQNGASETATYTIAGKSGVTLVTGDSSDAPAQLFDLSGRRVSDSEAPAGVYILRQGAKITKIIKK
ncbi:MAG: T9SS type A sorting domain-containing protein, partial [Muribaculaceae bacterium]|nr:T9SS type A sorting domain-containing protein [Muribaculaceae bacterium]